MMFGFDAALAAKGTRKSAKRKPRRFMEDAGRCSDAKAARSTSHSDLLQNLNASIRPRSPVPILLARPKPPELPPRPVAAVAIFSIDLGRQLRRHVAVAPGDIRETAVAKVD